MKQKNIGINKINMNSKNFLLFKTRFILEKK